MAYIIRMKDKPILTFHLEPDFYDRLERFTQGVLQKGFEIFKPDFQKIDAFYATAVADKSARDDHAFRRTAKPFYLIEALYYKIYDEFNREAFNRAKETVIIVPQCLALMQEKCQRKRGKYGKICNRCVPNCQINKISEIASLFGVDTYFSKRGLEKQLGRIKRAKPSLSVIGISCVLTLASGMRTAAELGIPARGVFLNFTGCDHWTDKPFATETSLARLKEILEEKYGLSHPSSS
ncbi:hypothetical protein TRIP_C60586 [Candidatus Zixiibacteriota bacterium]|nr:hypothetical protein TRIP_C60586 [candidate division Zixibacteria bacterium]